MTKTTTTRRSGKDDSSNSKSKSKQPPHRGDRGGSKRVVTSLHQFAQKKGQVRALEEFRKRKEKKRVETAKALRIYQKVMRQEGMEAGKGASRRRKQEEEKDDAGQNPPPSKEQRRRPHRSNPLQKSLQKAAATQEAREARQEQIQQNEHERQSKLKQRKKQTKLLQKRTKKGQPIIKHQMDNLLRKLQKQNEE
ncbi:MAG: hypothetical protein SGARI_008352 [Bacillariaceae sp.]